MNQAKINRSGSKKPLRLWPGIGLVVVLLLTWWVLPRVAPSAGMISVLGGALLGLLIIVWWAFFSRAAGVERWGAVVLMVGSILVTRALLHESIATAGQGMLFIIYAIPVLGLAFAFWAFASRNLADRTRRATMVATILLACGSWALLRTEGVSASGSDFAWRWTKTAEEQLLAREAEQPMAASAAPTTLPERAEWPGFRGAHRDGVVRGERFETDWASTPPVELWRQAVGPGWSSFAVHGDLLYTQEQRGDDEVVSCYRASTGEPVWQHRDSTRFWESNAGAGPRGTPTLDRGRIYTFGATGILNALDASDGTPAWSRNVAEEAAKEIPYWGFSSSPLVVGEEVFVAAAGRLAVYDRISGEPRWMGQDAGGGYSSPHLLKIDGIEQLVLQSAKGTTSFAPVDGAVLWEHAWEGYPVVQPALTADGDLLLSSSESSGLRRLAVAPRDDGWALEERWTSNRLKPYFNDFVVHQGHAYGFDGSILASINLEDGQRNWKGGRYGQGQMILLTDQSLLLVLSEQGDLALVSATPDSYTELARVPALDGKTWNHPVLVGDLLLVRNSEEMAAFRLALEGG